MYQCGMVRSNKVADIARLTLRSSYVGGNARTNCLPWWRRSKPDLFRCHLGMRDVAGFGELQGQTGSLGILSLLSISKEYAMRILNEQLPDVVEVHLRKVLRKCYEATYIM